MSLFDEARQAAEDMFANQEQTNEEIPAEEIVEEPTETEEIPEEVPAEATEPVEETPSPEEAALDEATNVAEIAAQTAQQKDAELQQVLHEIEALRRQNQQMQGTIEELSKKNEENLIEEAMQMPTLDVNGLAFATEEEAQQIQADYAAKMTEFVRSGIMKEMEPFLQQAKEGRYQKEKTDTLEALSQVAELQGINDMLPQLDKIIANNKWLNSDDMSMEEKYINAYAIARGVNAINTPPVVEEPKKELTDDELMELYDKNPTFQELIEKRRIDAVKNSQQVPPFSASSGAVNAALNIPEKPKTFEEASERTRKMFGLD